MAKKTRNSSAALRDAIINYYQFNPDTLMPLLMLALAAQQKLSVVTNANKAHYIACALEPEEICSYDWVKLDPSLKRRVSKWNKEGADRVCVVMDMGRSLLPIYKIFKQNDETDVVQEYHHRIGRLVHHSGNAASEKAQRQYASFVLAETLIGVPVSLLRDCYFSIFNHILELSGLQTKRPRIEVAQALNTLLDYDGDGLVYNPFAGCSIVGAMMGACDSYYGDGDRNDKLYAAGLLLNYGMGVSNEHFIQRDSRLWLEGKKIDYVVSTYTGFIDGESAFDFCLGKCLEDKGFTGRYAGMVQPKEIFEKQTPNFLEALDRDWISAIALLPFGEVAVLVDANKSITSKGTFRFIDGTNPLVSCIDMEDLINDDMFSQVRSTCDAKKKGFLRSLVVTEPQKRDGYRFVRMSDVVSKVERKVYDLDKVDEDLHVLAYINRDEQYNGSGLDENIGRRPVSSLFGPAYLVERNSLIVNASGAVEPRIFDADWGGAFFNDGYVFTPKDGVDLFWLVGELQESYVRLQLHPYGNNSMVPEMVSENDYLNLVIYKKLEPGDEGYVDKEEEEKKKAREDAIAHALPEGFVLRKDNMTYTILNFISNGAFGYTYRAEMKNNKTGESELVAIKEYFPRALFKDHFDCVHDGGRVVGDPDHIDAFEAYKKLFKQEPEFILSLADVADNHVTEIKSFFEIEENNTVYYCMKYYAGLSLKDMVETGRVPKSEKLIVDKIVVPLCKALKAMHSHRVLHLDIKPDNVVIDENGEAVLIDFGVAQLYSEDGLLIKGRDGGMHSYSEYSAPENVDGYMQHFVPTADIFGACATLFNLLTNKTPRPVKNLRQKSRMETLLDCSDKMASAVLEGLYEFAADRPQTAQELASLFPGAEDFNL